MPQPLQKLREFAREHDTLRKAARFLGVLAVLALIIVGIWVVWRVPQWQVQHSLDVARNDPALKNTPLLADSAKQLELEDNFRKTLVQGLGGAIVLLGLYYSARTFGLSRQGHITDRFTKAIEQLGKVDGDKPNIEVRLGAIYALERIAIDSPRDHWTIMEVLTAYVRRNAPLDPDRAYTKNETPRTDIQAILTVLGRRKTGPTRERSDQYLDLRNSHLCGVSLITPNLQDAVLAGANLQDAFLYRANLQDTRLDRANLQAADLTEVNLQDAFLIGANLQAANLSKANPQGTNLSGANLEAANLWKANLRDAFLLNANLQGALLWKVNLQDADLSSAKLQGALLDGANLQGANLTDANLVEIKGWTLKQIKSASNWDEAHYSHDLREALGLPPEETIEEHTDPDSDKPTENA
jgi:hypothetical protein